jgi:hypothetical protein
MLTLAAWPIAFLVVIAVSTVFDNAFASLPRPLVALVLSGVVVAVMVNLRDAHHRRGPHQEASRVAGHEGPTGRRESERR